MNVLTKQTQGQFEILYGDRSQWSRTTLAAYNHLFNNEIRSYSATQQGISVQTLGQFLKQNKIRHIEMAELLQKAKGYEEAGDNV